AARRRGRAPDHARRARARAWGRGHDVRARHGRVGGRVSARESGPFWEGLARGELRAKRCGACGRFVPLDPRVCSFCRSTELAWARVGGRGRLASFTIVHRAPSPAFADQVPYVLALVDLDEGVRMMARLVRPGGAAHVW